MENDQRIDNDPTFQRNLLLEYVAETECERTGVGNGRGQRARERRGGTGICTRKCKLSSLTIKPLFAALASTCNERVDRG